MPSPIPPFLRRLVVRRRALDALSAERAALSQLAEYEAASRRLLAQARTVPGNRGHW